MIVIRNLVLIAACLASLTAHADFQQGLAAIASRDYATALKNFKPLAEQGNVAAQINLGNLYMKGLGVEQNYQIAMRWYRSAADQGERIAKTKLGILYYLGLGVERNPTEAAKWFREAAEQGDTSAQATLGSLYAEGEGVPKDPAQAYYWYTLAEEHGNQDAAKGRKSLEEELTPGQRDEAFRLMSETKKKVAEEEEKAFEATVAGLGKPPGSATEETAPRNETQDTGAPAKHHGKHKRHKAKTRKNSSSSGKK